MAAAFTGVQGTQVKHARNTCPPASIDNSLNQFNVYLVKTLAATTTFIQDSGHTDHGICTLKLCGQVISIVNIGLDQLNTGQQFYRVATYCGTGQHHALMLVTCQCVQKVSTEKPAGAYQYYSHLTSLKPFHHFEPGTLPRQCP
jgi:hypothetical protein